MMEAPPHEYPHTTHCYKLSLRLWTRVLAAVVTRKRGWIRRVLPAVYDSGLDVDGEKHSDSYQGTASEPCHIRGQI
jgi:hypothetical protein